ncbi:MAG: 50S ribosomal protein L11 methyltransferase [Nitrospirae bacterium]|nr:50S ribosomal protein L11 methyltransferase [Nitrospirota bacterium]
MGYYEFTIRVSDRSKDALLNRMDEMGCLGVSENRGRLVAYFRDSRDIILLRDGLNLFREVLRGAGLDPDFSFDYVYLSERDWNETWKKKFVPIDPGEKLAILPPWESARCGRIGLIIDPGMAFGTGHHETTKTCLMLIEKYVSGLLRNGPAANCVRKDCFLDVGTGTGILAIAASKLGFAHVTGVDIDPVAVDAAARNAELNDLGNVEIREGGIGDVEGRFDLIAANLMSEVLIGIAPEIASCLGDGALAILSGMLVGQEDDVIAGMKKAGLALLEKYYDGRWASVIVGRRR